MVKLDLDGVAQLKAAAPHLLCGRMHLARSARIHIIQQRLPAAGYARLLLPRRTHWISRSGCAGCARRHAPNIEPSPTPGDRADLCGWCFEYIFASRAKTIVFSTFGVPGLSTKCCAHRALQGGLICAGRPERAVVGSARHAQELIG